MKKGLSVLLILALMMCALALHASAWSTLDNVPQGYYIVGTMNDWTVRGDYKINSYDSGQTYRFPLYMTPDDSFKIVYSSDGVTPDTGRYYPAGEGNAFNQESQIIKENGVYVFAFRPALDGGRGYFDNDLIYHADKHEVWYYDCIICEGYEKATYRQHEPATESGYYIVGTMNGWKPSKYYQMNTRTYTDSDQVTHLLCGSSYPLTLRRGDTFKIAYSEDGENITRLYPEGEGNAYNEDETRIFYDGQELYVSFSPQGLDEYHYDYSGKPAHCGMIAVQDLSMWDCLTPLEIPAKPNAAGVYLEAFQAAYPEIDDQYLDYEELYTHRDKNGDPDWVLVWARNFEHDYKFTFSVVGSRAFYQYAYSGNPFLTHYGVYDVKKGCFFDPGYGKHGYFDDEQVYHEGFKVENYADFDRVMEEYATADYNSLGRLLGDIDRDDQISVIDVTLFQRCEAGISEWPEKDAVSLYDSIKKYTAVPGYYSDFNCDGDRDILDATCIQRYMAEMPYPKNR